MYHNILIPTDGSEGAAVAVKPALDLAEKFDANIHLLFVLDTKKIQKVSHQDLDFSHIRASAARIMDEILSTAKDRGIDGERHIVEQFNAPDSIQTYITDHNIDLVIMGSHGRSGLARLMLGSTTEQVLRSSSVSVMVIPIDDNKPEQDHIFG